MCHLCNRTGHLAKVCRSRTPAQPRAREPATNAVHVTPSINTTKLGIQPAPTIQVELSTRNGSTSMQVLRDSGADISVAGPNIIIIRSLNDHRDNLLPSWVTPRTVNGRRLTPISKLPVQIKIRNHTHKDELHIYPNIEGVLISWKACKALSILPQSYPEPTKVCNITSTETAQHLTSESLIQEFPSVF